MTTGHSVAAKYLVGVPLDAHNECRAAIIKLWPAETRTQALVVLHRENGSEDHWRISPRNHNGTYDLGCMQVNSVHFPNKTWTNHEQIFDADFNVRQSLAIFHGAHDRFRPWYSVCGLPGRADVFDNC